MKVTKKKLKLKNPVIKLLKIFGIILGIVLTIFLLYNAQLKSIMKYGYSREASKNIFFSFKKDYVLKIGENKTLNAAFESDDYKEKNLDSYSKIDYYDQKHLIKNINTLISKGYSNSNISMILAHGNDDDVTNFAKRKKIRYLEEFYSISYAKLKYYDDYINFSDDTGEDEETTVLYVNLGLNKDDYKDPSVVKKFSTDMLVNKHYKLEKNFVPNDLIDVPSSYTSEKIKGSRVAVTAFVQMAKDANKNGYEIVINSGYRSYDDQVELCDYYRNLYGDSYVDKYVAFPGFSEHQTGLAFDIGSKNSNVFANSKEYEWMLDNAYKYGFILRFSKRGEKITGFRNEPWHYRFVGKKIAKYIHDNNITFERYYVEFLNDNF